MSYKDEGQKLLEEVHNKDKAVFEKYKNYPPSVGLGLSPEARELRQNYKWFLSEMKKLQEKYNLKTPEDVKKALE